MSEELDKAIEALRKPWLISENRESVVVYRDDLTLALDRLEELEDLVAAAASAAASAAVATDVTSELQIGDEVVTLIDYMDVTSGMQGKVVRLIPSYEYPIDVEFEDRKYPVGYKRDELGKWVSK